MSNSQAPAAVSRTRSLKLPPLGTFKPTTSTISTSTTALTTTSNIALFLTNLRLLDLDLRPDWPDISQKTFSTKDAQQNQKKRVQCVEWALYQLFALWDPEETQNKLQPFFPPLEPLQSLNLRAALFRCLDQAKKNGVLGRDTVLRKTMLDECKGERLDEVLAVFSNAVLKRLLQQSAPPELGAIAQQLAYENFSYSGERSVLSALILAHKAALKSHLQQKENSRAKYTDFSELLGLNERRITRRHEQLKEVLAERGNHENISATDIKYFQSQVQKNWSGSEEWLGTILYGDSKVGEDGLLATQFDKVWKNVEAGTIGDIESKGRVGLLEQLDARVKDQENRLARWQTFSKGMSKKVNKNPTQKTNDQEGSGEKKIDLDFNLHQKIQISRSGTGKSVETQSASLEEYTKLIENMRSEISEIRNPSAAKNSHVPVRQSLGAQKRKSLVVPSPRAETPPKEQDQEDIDDDDWSSASDIEQSSPGYRSQAARSMSRTQPPESPTRSSLSEESDSDKADEEEAYGSDGDSVEVVFHDREQEEVEGGPQIVEGEATLVAEDTIIANRAPPLSPLPALHTPPRRLSPPSRPQGLDTESDLANQILNSMSEVSPSPKKPRQPLSLAERTRLSMARKSHMSELHDEFDVTQSPRLAIKPRQSFAPPVVEESDLHAGLIERTRKSMAGFEAAQKKAQLARRKSVIDAKKKARESTYFPKVEEEPSVPDISAIELMEGDPDYESVFKSRPKIQMSPAPSPTREMDEDLE
ncbi:hypothetical protein HYFRA_00010662 [Hymenoscyphus fraxineus]|uniref:HAUS augmin-like complex subunit 6 N-terminal domain-containing protein n=1 Tax=Hymenoscyphus fraxineus TaxID=746836 RepID=A0A9N9L8U6_9HELO|nr:hypothetical protein HYFRA_00010662 [Hymenoscyphus fraxineus]